MILNPQVPGVLEAPMSATESGANRFCQKLLLLELVPLLLFNTPPRFYILNTHMSSFTRSFIVPEFNLP